MKNKALFFSYMLFATTLNASEEGLVNFNLGKSPVSNSPVQPISLYGCNEAVNADLFWDTDGQIVGNIPYGDRKSESGKEYRTSKYYISSPPVFRKGSNPHSPKQQPFIGLVTPDSFTFKGDKPSQIVYFDYRILKPTYLKFIAADYSYTHPEGKSCKSLGVDAIPLNIQCSDFPWRNGALGASGIANITRENNKVFLPLLEKDSKPLQCSVSILDDIILDHDIYFSGNDNKKTKTINLTEYHHKSAQMKLMCFKRQPNDIPSGCK